MKKIVLALLAVFIIASFFSCGSKIPGWYLDRPTAKDMVYGVGTGEKRDIDASIRSATLQAVADMARQMSADVKSALKEYYQEAGVDDNTQVIEFYEEATKMVTDIRVEGYTVEKTDVVDGVAYVMVSSPKDAFYEEVEEIMGEFERNEAAAFAEFKAEEALGYLENM